MITGAQIREARAQLGWPIQTLARRSRLTPDAIRRAESVDDDPPLTVANVNAIEAALRDAGIKFEDLAPMESSGALLGPPPDR